MLNKSRLFLISICILLAGTFAQQTFAKNEKKSDKPAKVEKVTKAATLRPVVVRPVRKDTTPIPLREMKPIPFPEEEEDGGFDRNRPMPKALQSVGAKESKVKDSLVKKGKPSQPLTPSPFESFEGTDNNLGFFPPDTNGDVGPNHYVQTVNIQYQVWDKSGTSLLGPININTLWSGFGGDCQTHNNGDPIVLYDPLADRWLISQFALNFGAGADGHQCIAISTSGDPTGTYHRYDYIIGTDIINDYPHFGVWPDAYYMSVNQFDSGTFAFEGAGALAFERDEMLVGNPAAQSVYFNLFPVNNCFGGMLPADLDGPAPPAGTPNYFAEMDDNTFSCPVGSNDNIKIWEFHVDWTTPANSTFGVAGQPNDLLDTAAFDSNLCGYNGNCMQQPNTNVSLDPLSDRIMHRLQYRNFGTHATLATTHTVDVGGDQGGIRWYELRKTPPLEGGGGGWSIFQQGTYAPDAESRFMPSVSFDSAGNLGVVYSVSSNSVFPSIRYASRLSTDPLGELSQGETELIAGTGSQTGVDSNGRGRWGDYSSISVDPSGGSQGIADCDFWLTTEYIAVTGPANWQTRIGAFTYAGTSCGAAGCPNPPTITTTSLPNGQEGAAYNQTLQATGGTPPYTWSIIGSLPPGLSLDSATGVISGTPDPGSAGTYNFTARVDDTQPNCFDTQDLSIIIDPAPGACVYENDFNDGVLEWLEEKPTVTESGGFLNLTPLKRKAIAVADAAFGAQSVGTYTYVVNFTGGTFSKNWLYISRVDKKNQLEVLAKVDTGKLVVKDRNFAVVAKAKADFTWVPGTVYTIVINYDGTNIDVSVNGTPVIVDFVPSRVLPLANTGGAAKLNTMMIDNFCFE